MADDDLRNSRTKFNRLYSSDELALFARYVDARSDHRPAECTYGDLCWVRLGPPGLTGNMHTSCIGCGGKPRNAG